MNKEKKITLDDLSYDAKVVATLPTDTTKCCKNADISFRIIAGIESCPSRIHKSSIWHMRDANNRNIFYDFAQSKYIDTCGIDFKWKCIVGDNVLLSDDKRTFYSFPECKRMFYIPGEIMSYGTIQDYNVVQYRDSLGISTIFMNQKFEIVFTTNAELKIIGHPRILGFSNKTANGIDFIDLMTWKVIYTTQANSHTSAWHTLAEGGELDTILTGDEKSTTFVQFVKQKPENQCKICEKEIAKMDCAATSCGHTCFHFECVKGQVACPDCAKTTTFIKLIRDNAKS